MELSPALWSKNYFSIFESLPLRLSTLASSCPTICFWLCIILSNSYLSGASYSGQFLDMSIKNGTGFSDRLIIYSGAPTNCAPMESDSIQRIRAYIRQHYEYPLQKAEMCPDMKAVVEDFYRYSQEESLKL